MTEPGFKDHFSARSADYAANRPDYPPELGAFLAGHAPGRSLALDCGCGNGQLSVLLADHFDRVAATDASAQQIAAAAPHPRIAYRVAPAEASGLAPGSADLIVAAQAAHWFDLDAFYAEARRVARPGALLALVSYGVLHVEGDAEPPMQAFYWRTLAPYWPPERRHVEDGYRSLPFPFAEIAQPGLAIERAWTRAQLMGYVETWSAVREAEKAVGRGPVDALAAALASIWPDGERRRVRWPLAVRAGRIG
ncbi:MULTISPECIES: class I SAM-dependent methyltransferase [Rhodomicrobium]|uniref:class I SAM-dependent methyltransferase n=1 Tax=Rhodomicrobium TaxID=1068 RepID=UPI000B4B3A88|nr:MULTISPECIES: class I SAM-dependent methyltransferase [Rhodomicrobium]